MRALRGIFRSEGRISLLRMHHLWAAVPAHRRTRRERHKHDHAGGNLVLGRKPVSVTVVPARMRGQLALQLGTHLLVELTALRLERLMCREFAAVQTTRAPDRRVPPRPVGSDCGSIESSPISDASSRR